MSNLDQAPILLRISQAQKDAIEAAACAEGISTQLWLRRTLAKATGYDLDSEELQLRTRRKWPSEEARLEHYKQKARDDRKRNRIIQDAINRGLINLDNLELGKE